MWDTLIASFDTARVQTLAGILVRHGFGDLLRRLGIRVLTSLKFRRARVRPDCRCARTFSATAARFDDADAAPGTFRLSRSWRARLRM
ncbi:hypothetical protein [Tahibacter caeni]|uniref:hypothetical protein n=1 Tax=Tahibacter caeni TaxID=1453545 RepID=UPI0021490852|nr:hypothetical protein [Tahibacter caeni]